MENDVDIKNRLEAQKKSEDFKKALEFLNKLIVEYREKRKLNSSLQRYRQLTEFQHFKSIEKPTLVFGNVYNHVFVANEIYPTKVKDKCFVDHQYHIAFRQGEHHAQKDKAMNAIYKKYLGRATELDIIQHGKDFYVASRTIKDFRHFDLENYSIEPDGRLKDKLTGKIYTLRGLGTLIGIDYFFGCNDVHSQNWGFQEEGDSLFVYRIDAADAFDEDCLQRPINRKDIESLPIIKGDDGASSCFMLMPEELRKSKIVQEELSLILRELSEDFSIIKKILIDNIDTPPIDEKLWNIQSIFSPETVSIILNLRDEASKPTLEKISEQMGISVEELIALYDNVREQMVRDFKSGEFFRQDCYEITYVIQALEERHNQLRRVLEENTLLSFASQSRNEHEHSFSKENEVVATSISPSPKESFKP